MSTTPLLQVACTLGRRDFKLEADFVSTAAVTGIFGPSGSGKTTLLHAIAGLIRPSDGFIKVAGTPLVNIKGGWWLPPHHRRIGLLFQEDRLFPHLNVRDNLEFGYRRIPRAVRRLHPEEVISLLRLEPLLGRPVTALSGGEARRVALGRTLLTSPRLLLLDEPLTGLDASLRRDILAYLMDLPVRLDIPLVYVSHTRSDFIALVQHALAIRDGHVVEIGSPLRLLDETANETENDPLEAFLVGDVEASDEPGYVRLRVGGQNLIAMGSDLTPGTRARIALPAHEVLLAIGDVPHTSARNVLAATITELHPVGTRMLVALDIGQPLWAELTPTACRDLALQPGLHVHVLLKARTLHAQPY